ncbi:amino acid ABC transporter substrate-binding protein, PAAT family [Faunimonas pinastri]|uniref:Amino acid ABC transporter substrate-binding protein, PAAT family n=1 Tax=Faunimonas pinastri TaxID=1855383 RepID=A0A1H9CLD4_9HYPH|nr:ABC transporter substrate-binding protein [Faunimonas pinastri]SEQ02022.1 amino acid ABC transporter substrate-binding protein, PAAT family [Faunimonas pinastri]
MKAKKVLLAAAAVFLFAGACSAQAAGVDQKLRGMLPEKFQKATEIKVGTDPHQPPYDYYDTDNKTLMGLEQDLMKGMSERLGVKFVSYPAQFASIIPAIQAERFDVGISAFGDFSEREKILDVLDYTLEGTGIIVLKGNPHGIEKLSDSCGLRAAAVQGSIPLQLLDKQKGLCPADKPLTVMQFPSSDQAEAAIKSGRADLSMDTVGVAAYALAHQPTAGKQLELVSASKYAVGYQGILVSKKNPELRDAIQATLQTMIDDGTYSKIFAKYGLTQNEVKTITLNDAARWADYMKLD